MDKPFLFSLQTKQETVAFCRKDWYTEIIDECSN